MAIFEKQHRMATVRALGEVRVLTIDRRNLLQRIQEDPSLAFRVIEGISRKLRELDALLALRMLAERPECDRGPT
jgi:CRP-like cAMP-binding protein